LWHCQQLKLSDSITPGVSDRHGQNVSGHDDDITNSSDDVASSSDDKTRIEEYFKNPR